MCYYNEICLKQEHSKEKGVRSDFCVTREMVFVFAAVTVQKIIVVNVIQGFRWYGAIGQVVSLCAFFNCIILGMRKTTTTTF